MTTDELLAIALDHQRGGRLDEAEAAYRHILAADPNHFVAAHRFALIAQQRGDAETALRLIAHPRSLRPDDPALNRNLAEIFRTAGRYDQALAAARRAVELESAISSRTSS